MATLVSPGVSVTVTDESFFVPASAPTVPLIILATQENKPQTSLLNSPIAPGTQENNVVRTITSLSQSQSTFGIPAFQTTNGQPNHGDARNEYGLATLNKFLGQGSFAYTIRANVNLDDNFTDIQSIWESDIQVASSILENLVTQWIAQYNTNNQLLPSNPQLPATNTIAYNTPLVGSTIIPVGSSTLATATITIVDTVIPVSINYSTIGTIGALVNSLNTQLGIFGSAAIVGGKIVIKSTDIGPASIISITDGTTPHALFANLASALSYTGPTFTPVAGTAGFAVTIPTVDLFALIQQATSFIWQDYNFGLPTTPTTLQSNFLNDQTSAPFAVFANGFASSTTGTFLGVQGTLFAWLAALEGGTVPGQLTATEAGNFLLSAGDDFEWTNNFLFKTSLGTDDASRRAAIVQALTAVVNGNQDIRAETIEYNLILCPGYPELASSMQALVVNFLNSEVLVIGDTPMNVDPQALSTWAGSIARVIDVAGNVVYYYPHILTTNLDGTTILVPSSAQALTTYAFSDNVSFEWFAPAGVNRGKIVGITDLGYCTGVLGTANTFVTLHPNKGQRDVMYGYTATGALNPLVFFPGNGFLVWGQKTSTGTTATALDRVNVSRLVKFIARSLRKAALPFVFEPNDALTQNNLKAMVDGFLGTLITKRGLYDFATICDSSNNTPTVVENNQLIIEVALKPVKASEFIFIPITIVSTGATIN